MGTVSMSMNTADMIKFCSKYNCTTDQISRVLKSSVLDLKHSPYWRALEGDQGAERIIAELKRSENYSTSEETKIVVKTIIREYVETLKELLSEDEVLKERVFT